MQPRRRTPRPRSIIPDHDAPPMLARWFHAIDNPMRDPVAERRAQHALSVNKNASRASSSVPLPPPKSKPPTKWMAFSKRDSAALEKAYEDNDIMAKVPVNEDHLFEVDVSERTISPVYWQGPTYEVRRATWFVQGEKSKWLPCEETLAEQIELGYYKHKPYHTGDVAEKANDSAATTTVSSISSLSSVEEKKLEMTLSKQPVEKHWNLLGPYLGQYIVYTGPNTAWLLSNSASSKLAKSIITRFTNKQNLGGTRLIRGYPEVEKQQQSKAAKTAPVAISATKSQEDRHPSKVEGPSAEDVNESKEKEEESASRHEVEDYENEDSEEEVRRIDHVVFAIHGVGQKMSEKSGQTFVHDVNMLRKTLKTAYPMAIANTASPQRANGIQVLPILWRQDIKFGMACDDEGVEADLSMLGVEDGSPTLEELTLEGVPNIRTVISDVLLDIPLYMTPKYREQMTNIITREINKVYRLFVQRNPDFLEKMGKVSIFGHSLGSLLAFDMLSMQPPDPPTFESAASLELASTSRKASTALLFPVQNFIAAGSPLGVMLLLRGYKIASRKSSSYPSPSTSTSTQSVPVCSPAVENLYNIFHRSDPVAYRLEPLISRHYGANVKPEPIPYLKGGLKGVIDAGINVGSGIANRAGAMYESLKMGITANLFMRGLGISRQQMYEDSRSAEHLHDSANNDTTTRMRSNSDPALAFSSQTKSPTPEKTNGSYAYSYEDRKIKSLNVTGRVDYCLQEGLLEHPYLYALNVHMQYWQDLDVAAFVICQLYR